MSNYSCQIELQVYDVTAESAPSLINVSTYRRVGIKCPWAGTVSMLQKRGVGPKCVLSAYGMLYPPTTPERPPNLFSTKITYRPGKLDLELKDSAFLCALIGM